MSARRTVLPFRLGEPGPDAAQLQSLLPQAETIGAANREWIARHALFGDAVERFVARLYAFDAKP